MKYIQLGAHLSDDLRLKSVTIDYNDTELKSDSELIKNVAWAILKSLVNNKESVAVQDLLSELEIKREQL